MQEYLISEQFDMNPKHIPSVDVEPIEDINPFMTRHAILKTTGASYSHSLFSASIDGKQVPNRDYPYEGLTAIINNENWKFLDGIAIGILQDGAPLSLTPTTVTINPWQHIFRYAHKTGVLEARYMLDSPATADGVVCYLTITNKTNPKTTATMPEESCIQIVAEPLFDIRHMYAPSDPGACEIIYDDGVLLVQREGHAIGLRIADNSTNTINPSTMHANRRVYDWWYKLGSGYRTCGGDNCAYPSGEGKQVLSAGDIVFNGEDTQIVIVIACSNSAQAARKLLDTAAHHNAVEEKKRYYAQEVEQKLMAAVAAPDAIITSKTTDVLFRTLGMLSFGMRLQDSILHEAGDFWFKNVWFRDEFEGLLSNVDTLFTLGHHGYIKSAVEKALEYQDIFGRVPNHIPTRADDEISYNSADATLLTFIAAGRYIERMQKMAGGKQNSDDDKDENNTDAESFIHTVLRSAEQMVSAFSTNTNTPNGAPILQDDGLITVPAWHSWTDCNYYDQTCGARLPIRTLRLEGLASPEYDLPQFLLPEINAQWICALLHIRDMCDIDGAGNQYLILRDRVNGVLKKAIQSYRVVFYNKDNGFLYNCVFKDQHDPTLGSPAVVAMSMLSESTDMFSSTEVRDFCTVTRNRLIALRNDEPFGVLVREGADIYYNDDQYHMAVTWPRDTPYLLSLFRAGGMMDEVEAILKNNLAHQMDEGFVGYNSELFSIDPTGLTPVKNPVQWWSQWCDEFLK